MYPIKVVPSSKYGRTVVAMKDFKKGDVIEIAPAIVIYSKHSLGLLDDYLFGTHHPKKDLVGFGYASMYNHRDNPNAEWTPDLKRKRIVIRAIQNIAKNKEIFVSYGDEYWSSRKNLKKL